MNITSVGRVCEVARLSVGVNVNGIQIARHGHLPVEFFLNRYLQRLRRGRLAVCKVGLPWRGWQRRQPAQQFALTGVRGKLPHLDDLGVHRHVLPE